MLFEHSGRGIGQGQDYSQGQWGVPARPRHAEQEMETKETEEETTNEEDNSFIGKIKSFFGRGKKKEDDTNRMVGFEIPAFDMVVAGRWLTGKDFDYASNKKEDSHMSLYLAFNELDC